MNCTAMDPVRVFVVSRDPSTRLAMAKAFDAAPPEWVVEMGSTPPRDAAAVVYGPDMPDEGGIRFNLDEPGVTLTEIAKAVVAGANVIVVTSPSGGTGCTSVALHLAACAAEKQRVCLVDLDTDWGLAPRLGLPNAKTWADVGTSDHELLLAAIPQAPGFRALFAPRSESDATPGALIARVSRHFETVIVDAPFWPGLNEVFAQGALGVLVMRPSIDQARRAREVLAEWPDASWAVVTNRCGPGSCATRKHIEAELGRSVSVELPCCPRLRDAEDNDALMTTKLTRWSIGVRRLSVALTQ